MRLFLTCLMVVVLISSVSAEEISKEKIRGLLPGAPVVDSIRFDHELRLFEVVVQGQVFYLTEDLRFAFVGNIIDLKTQKNITAERVREVRRIEFASLPKEDAIKMGEGKRSLAVFTDPACSYCKKLHEELKKLKDVAIYIYLYPLDQEGVKRAVDIWCSDNRLQSYEAAVEGKRVRSSGCQDHPIQRNLSLGKRLFVNATPTIITDRNEVINGYVGVERLRMALAN